ncbi:hypothetical protein BT69DRAFT_773189 [Atractiella rhizophila]|nr:hypothetical protein BT69DRAFT_773189 [Atractiella rhizophila]
MSHPPSNSHPDPRPAPTTYPPPASAFRQPSTPQHPQQPQHYAKASQHPTPNRQDHRRLPLTPTTPKDRRDRTLRPAQGTAAEDSLNTRNRNLSISNNSGSSNSNSNSMHLRPTTAHPVLPIRRINKAPSPACATTGSTTSRSPRPGGTDEARGETAYRYAWYAGSGFY